MTNPLETHFDSVTEGPGVWKWRHYFDMYHKHLEKFRGTDAVIVELGVCGGGSLIMWQEYFGPKATIIGIDKNPWCKHIESRGVKVFVGNAKEPGFWHKFKQNVPRVDAFIDDGPHNGKMQIYAYQQMFGHLAPGGVYICEDIGVSDVQFASHICKQSEKMFKFNRDPKVFSNLTPSGWQAWIKAMTVYPLAIVVEKMDAPRTALISQRHGNVWPTEFTNVPA